MKTIYTANDQKHNMGGFMAQGFSQDDYITWGRRNKKDKNQQKDILKTDTSTYNTGLILAWDK